jgi:hypothetical protein
MPDELTLESARDRLRDATRIVLDKEREYEHAVERAADAEAFYRSQLADHFKAHREAGKAVSEADTLARGELATASRERDYAAGMLKLAGEKLENARDSRRSLWRLIEWAGRRDVARGAVNDERVPSALWP